MNTTITNNNESVGHKCVYVYMGEYNVVVATYKLIFTWQQYN